MVTINKRGFTLIELIVVSAIIAILAAMLVPVIIAEVDDSRISRAKGDLKTIQTAIAKFKVDNGAWPNRVDGSNPATNTVQVLCSDGKAISSASDWPVTNDLVYKQLKGYLINAVNDRGYPAATWKGPYMSAVEADPWGNTYLVGAVNFEPTPPLDPAVQYPVWIVSAGPDGILQTSMNSTICFDGKTINPATGVATVGDDICLRFK